MSKPLYPFLAPPYDGLTIVQRFDAWLDWPDMQYTSPGVKPGLTFAGSGSRSLLAPMSGQLAIVPSLLTLDEPNGLSEFLEVGTDAPAPPEPANNTLVGLFLQPNAIARAAINAVLPLTEGKLLGFRFSDLPYQALRNSASIQRDNEGNGDAQTLRPLSEVLTDPTSPVFQQIVILGATSVTDMDIASRWGYFASGAHSVTVPAGLVIATLPSNTAVDFAVLTTRGFIDPGRFYDLCTSVLDELVDIGSFIQVGGSNGAIPVSADFSTLGTYDEFRSTSRFIKTSLFEAIADVHGAATYDDIGNRQKELMRDELHQIGGYNGTSYANLAAYANASSCQWFRNWDWHNPFQLEALVEFYLNFRSPLSGTSPIRPTDSHYRRVRFNTREICSRNVDEVSASTSSAAANPDYVPTDAYPPLQFPFILVLVDGFEHLGGKLPRPYAYDPKSIAAGRSDDGQADDRYEAVLFVVERFQRVNGLASSAEAADGHPRVIGLYPWTSESSQRNSTAQSRSSIAGNLSYIAFSNPAAGNDRINYAFELGNSYISAIDPRVKPVDRPFLKWGTAQGGHDYADTLPGILDPLGYALPSPTPSQVDPNGKGAVFLHMGHYSSAVTSTGSEGCLVSPEEEFHEMRKKLLTSLLEKFDPSGTDTLYAFCREIRDEATAQDVVDKYNDDLAADTVHHWPNYGGWGSGPTDARNLRSVLFVIRPIEPPV